MRSGGEYLEPATCVGRRKCAAAQVSVLEPITVLTKMMQIKCDGKLPACTHCVNYKTECVFTLVEKKRNPPKGLVLPHPGALKRGVRVLATMC